MKVSLLTLPRIGPVLFTALVAVIVLTCGICRAEDVQAQGKTYEGTELAVRVLFEPLPDNVPGGSGDTPEMAALGKRLYFERGISLDGSQSCNDCHRLDEGRAGVDNQPTSRGVKGEFGKRNSPTVLNAGLESVQFWDGRAPDLAEQAKGPVLNPVEMAMGSAEDVVARLKAKEVYRTGFEKAFPGQAEPVTFDNMAKAIAAFERTLVTPSRFDRYLKGDKTALTEAELRGLKRFVDTGCVQCHSGMPVGGRLLQKFGVYHPYEGRSDPGRYGVTKQEEDVQVFKVPMLRNITRTGPYFHDGHVPELRDAVWIMAWMQLDTRLSPDEAGEIVSFLHALEAERPLDVKAP